MNRDRKNSSYFSRFQVKYKRRREGKTDYRARIRLVKQDKTKYESPKHRLVVRFTNKDIICQIIYPSINGDIVVSSAYAHELPSYGLKVGLKNYAAAYCVGLLCARRCLVTFGLDSIYKGDEDIIGEKTNLESLEEGPRPFRVILDCGLKRTSTGSKIFAVLKGASNGGIYVPHNEKRFVGFDSVTKKFDAEKMKEYIYGEHVSNYMDELYEEEPDGYHRQFSRYFKQGIEYKDLAEIYDTVHEAIRTDPERKTQRII